ncbi:histidine kinase [Noviherbaspirillum sp. 17J57-3]|uniref:Histidine kinase n=2 Tax=Noviherbaspirillum galbum TaxID=2709383 RepID=A0A6B3SU00_9BURK|nr:histidine kinase [Noviherbaspirillum galbum]
MTRSIKLFVTALAFTASSLCVAAESGTADEATAMVKKAVAYLKANGKDKTLAEVSNNKGQFVDRDLYISVYDMQGNVLAHGTNPKLIGKDVSALKDANGKEFIKDIIGQAKTGGKGHADYVWPNPVTKELQPKTVYFEKTDDMIFSSGYYKR